MWPKSVLTNSKHPLDKAVVGPIFRKLLKKQAEGDLSIIGKISFCRKKK